MMWEGMGWGVGSESGSGGGIGWGGWSYEGFCGEHRWISPEGEAVKQMEIKKKNGVLIVVWGGCGSWDRCRIYDGGGAKEKRGKGEMGKWER